MEDKDLHVLAFDIGGTKTAWGIVDGEGTIKEHGQYPTPRERDEFVARIKEVIATHPQEMVIGLGMPGTHTADSRKMILVPNIPTLNGIPLCELVEEDQKIVAVLDNDGRCALIAEAWLGAAKEPMSTVMITLGTGVGGAVMQKGKVLPHPTDLSDEISRLVAYPEDLFRADAGRGSVEGLIAGKSLEERFDVKMGELKERVKKGDEEAQEIFDLISDYFFRCLQAIHFTYNCKRIIVGGHGAEDLDLYLQGKTPPCSVIPAELGQKAGLLGAARIALDKMEDQLVEKAEWD